MCLRRLNSSTKRFDSIQDVWDFLQSRSKFTKASKKSNSSRLTEEHHERFSITTIDGTFSMFIFNALVLSLTRPDFFSRAIIEPRVQTPLPAPPGCNFRFLFSIFPVEATASPHNRFKRTADLHIYANVANPVFTTCSNLLN